MILKRLLIFIILLSPFFSLAFEISDLEWAKNVGAREIPEGEKIYNATDYGAVGDDRMMNTANIQAAIDACSQSGGGKITFDKGIYLTGALYLKSGIIFEIPEGVTILGSQNINDYSIIDTRIAGVEIKWPSALINVLDQKSVLICGNRTVNGQGRVFWDLYWQTRREYETRGLRWIVDYDVQRPRTFLVSDSEDITVKDITFQQAGFWTVQILYSSYCTINGVIIRNNIDGRGPSTDGIDIDSSTRILVENCDVDCNDDNYCLKVGRDADRLRVNRPTEYVVIRNCISRAGDGMVVCGSETSGGIRNILVHDMVAKGTSNGIYFKSAVTRGGFIENIYVKNIEMEDVRSVVGGTINWNPTYSYSKLPEEYAGKELPDHWRKMLQHVPIEKGIPYVRNIYISSIIAKNARTDISIEGMENSFLENFNFKDVKIEVGHAGRISYVKDWVFTNTEIIASDQLTFTNTENISFER